MGVAQKLHNKHNPPEVLRCVCNTDKGQHLGNPLLGALNAPAAASRLKELRRNAEGIRKKSKRSR